MFCRTLGVMPPSQSAVHRAVADVDHKTEIQPRCETKPRSRWQVVDQINAADDAEHGNDQAERYPERSRPVRVLHSQNDNTGAHEYEREQRPDVCEVYHLVDACDGRERSYKDAGDYG